jgi:hypothetical protein
MKIFKEFKIYRQLSKTPPALVQLMTDVLDFINKVHKEGKPMISEIAMIDIGTNKKVCDMVTLWAGVGDANPLKRCAALKAQTEELKRLLKIATEGNLSESDKINIKLVLDCFD